MVRKLHLATPRARRRLAATGELYITRIAVEQLFGALSYSNIPIKEGLTTESRVSVIYGDNGAGKTTVLRLTYACLSPQRSAGLRSMLAQTPFKYFCVHLSDGHRIEVLKEDLVGKYTYRVTNNDISFDLDILVDADGDVCEQESIFQLEVFLRKLDLDILFVDHSRSVRSTYAFLADLPTINHDHFDELINKRRYYFNEIQLKSTGRQDANIQFPLSQIVDAVDKWFRNQAFRLGAEGEQNASGVYLEIAKAIGRTKKTPAASSISGNIRDTLLSLKNVTKSFIDHGLLSSYPFDELINIYEGASKTKKSQIETVLTPFLDTIQRRISSLNTIDDVMTIFGNELNKYFTKKKAHVHILEGFKIRDLNDEPLDLDHLSSGEKQLVFLLSAAVVSRTTRSLILIDEPELSLNYKWQRMIAESLSNISAATNTQYILASHSVEIITRHVNTATELTPE